MVLTQYFYWQGDTLGVAIFCISNFYIKQFPWKLQATQGDLFNTSDFALPRLGFVMGNPQEETISEVICNFCPMKANVDSPV